MVIGYPVTIFSFMPGILEICCTSFQSALIAQQEGANRIELCDNIFEGGTTPSLGMISQVCNKLDIDCYVLIRPRGGDFNYSDDEFEIMKSDIQSCKEAGVEGIVSGVLTPQGNIDIERTKELVALSGEIDFTFHRAFDLVSDPEKSLKEVISTGAKRILTSGLQNNLVEGIPLIQNLLIWAKNDIKIMVGGGLNSNNITEIIEQTGCQEYHTTAKTWVDNNIEYDSMLKLNGSSDIPENKQMLASPIEIRLLRDIIDKNFNCA
jgi:copper homeostasis protein